MSIHSALVPSFDSDPSVLLAWQSTSGRWYAELRGVPVTTHVIELFDTLDEALTWARAQAPRVLFQDPETTACPEVLVGDEDMIARMRRQEIIPTSEDEPVSNAHRISPTAIPQELAGQPPLDAADSWYLLEMWDGDQNPTDGEAWRIGGENRITDVLRWTAGVLGRREWSLKIVTLSHTGETCMGWLYGDRGFYVEGPGPTRNYLTDTGTRATDRALGDYRPSAR